MKLSCMSLMVPGRSLTEKAEKLASWGYDGIAVFVDSTDWNNDVMNEVLTLESKTGMEPCELVIMDPLYGHLMDSDDSIRRNAITRYKETIEICVEIGAVTELEYEYGIQDPLPLFDPYAQMSNDQEKAFLDTFEELADVAKGSDAFVLLEPINRYEAPYLNSLEDCMRVVSKVESPNVGLLPDTFHLSIEEKDIVASLKIAGDMTKHVHLGDNNRLLPGYGNIDWAKCIKSLKEIGYEGYLNLECGIPGAPDKLLPKTAAFLRSLL